MKEFWTSVRLIFSALGGWIGFFLVGCDGLLYSLLVFIIIDYATGVMCAVSDRKLSSAAGFKGICRKILILLLVGLAHVLDAQVLNTPGVLRTAVIFFFLANDGLSILENVAHLGLPVPASLKAVLEQLHDRAEKSDTPAVVTGEPVEDPDVRR